MEVCDVIGHIGRDHWKLMPCRMFNADGSKLVEEEYICKCEEGKGHIIIVSYPEDEEWWQKEGKICPYCGEKRVLRYERQYYSICSVCGETF